MKRHLFLIAICILCFTHAQSQNNVFAFFEYDVKSGMDDQFISGYAKDLEWHSSQGDDWSWIGWFVLNGERRGRYIDATPNHSWEDFDNWKVSSSENGRHNKIHWLPYVENPSGSYKILLNEYSKYNQDWVITKFLLVFHIKVRNDKNEIFKDFLANYKSFLESNFSEKNSFVWMKTMSGGDVYGYQFKHQHKRKYMCQIPWHPVGH